MDWSKFDLAMADPRYLHGAPVFREEPRMLVQAVLGRGRSYQTECANRWFSANCFTPVDQRSRIPTEPERPQAGSCCARHEPHRGARKVS